MPGFLFLEKSPASIRNHAGMPSSTGSMQEAWGAKFLQSYPPVSYFP